MKDNLERFRLVMAAANILLLTKNDIGFCKIRQGSIKAILTMRVNVGYKLASIIMSSLQKDVPLNIMTCHVMIYKVLTK